MSVGRAPNGKTISAEKAGVAVTERGFIEVDGQMRTNVPHIHAIGDVVGQPMLAHKATHEGHVAAEAAAGQKSFFDARVVPSVAYTDPEIAWVGLTEDEAKAKGINIEKGLLPWAASGRARSPTAATKATPSFLFDAATHRIVGGGIVGTHAGDLIGEITRRSPSRWAPTRWTSVAPSTPIRRSARSVGLAAEVAEGTCTDLPPPRKK